MQTPAAVLSALQGQARHHITGDPGSQVAWQQWPGRADSGRPLLLIHGGFGSWTHWVANIEALSERFAVWTLDLPGLGSSDPLPRPWSTQAITQRVLAGWRELHANSAALDIAGFSFGGMIAGQLARQLGDQCQRCILIGASGFGSLHVQVELLPLPDATAGAADAAAIHRDNLSRLMLHDPSNIDELAVHIHSENLSRHQLRSRGLAGSNELAEMLPHIPSRLVGIWGEFDATAGGLAGIEARRELFRHAQADAAFHLLPGVGHWAMYESPAAVNRLICGDPVS